MRKPFKLLLCLAALLVILGAAVVAWQWENLYALRDSITMDGAAIEEHMTQNDQQLKDVMAQYQIQEHAFSQEELDSITENDAGVDSAAISLLEENPAPTPAADQTKPAEPAPTPPPKTEAVDYTAAIREQIAKMYVLKATYVSALEGMVAAAKAEYIALPAAEHTAAKKQEVVMARVKEISALEKSCDQKVAAVVAELRRLLKADGQDSSTADLVEKTYANEKRLKKAYYLSEFQK
ncbi:MAG: hypothetical protein RRY95_01015 [Oscillospiraceae bacterium]